MAFIFTVERLITRPLKQVMLVVPFSPVLHTSFSPPRKPVHDLINNPEWYSGYLNLDPAEILLFLMHF
jgi:hypothetical protein